MTKVSCKMFNLPSSIIHESCLILINRLIYIFFRISTGFLDDNKNSDPFNLVTLHNLIENQVIAIW